MAQVLKVCFRSIHAYFIKACLVIEYFISNSCVQSVYLYMYKYIIKNSLQSNSLKWSKFSSQLVSCVSVAYSAKAYAEYILNTV